ncbi:unnamed protein product [Cochlearia groenlandica]
MIVNKISSFVLLVISFMILLSCCSTATIYKVGDSNGWTVTKKDAYRSWVRNKVFHVGDSLVFEYNHNISNVIHISNTLEYLSCNYLSSKAVYNTGHDVVTLTEPGHYYFITSNHIQCVSGLKLDLLVVPRSSRPVSPPPPSKNNDPSPPISSPPPPQQSNTSPSGKVYKVGDSRGWSVYNSFYYYKWSEKREFYVGDTLLFQYNKDLHDVEEINSEDEFRNCEPNSTLAVYKKGHDLVKLTKPGVHYFVSMKTGLCTAGIKLQVTVLPLSETVTTPNIPKTRMATFPRVNGRNRWWWLRPFGPPHH